MMNIENIQNFLEQKCNLQLQQCKFLVAVSGGVDSVVLVNVLHELKIDFVIVHCNFQLREAESLRDENFVKLLGEKYQKEVFIKTIDTQAYIQEKQVSIQVAARVLRYEWFDSLLQIKTREEKEQQTISPKQWFLATAHHADDNVETAIHHFFRGTGIAGLHGILPKQNKIIRPLLGVKKSEIVQYAQNNQLTWVEDSSNATNKYTRNVIRHELIPFVEKIFPNVVDNILHNIERLTEVEMVFNAAIEGIKQKLLVVKNNEIHIPILKLQKQNPLKTVVFEIFKEFGFAATQVNEIIKLLNAHNGSVMVSETHRIIVNRNWLIIAPIVTTFSNLIVLENIQEELIFKEGILRFKLNEDITNLPTDANIASLDFAEIEWPLIIRPYKTGDYFYPLGMNKKKKISKFLIDKKMSITQKERVWVIESNKKIVWIIGERIDHRCRIKPNTKKVLQIVYQSVK